jgi:hypothetical protein
MAPTRAHLTLEVELDSEPISGSMQRADGPETPFFGWIELVSLLQAATTTREFQTHSGDKT